jgi:uncharacterized protein (DUF983 family)
MTTPNPILSGLRARCPRCGEGALFKNGLTVRDRCDKCGLSYAFADSGDGPAVFVIMILGALTLGGALFLEFRYEPPVWVHVVVWGIFIPIVAFGLLRLLKGVLINLQFAHKAEEGRLDTKKD